MISPMVSCNVEAVARSSWREVVQTRLDLPRDPLGRGTGLALMEGDSRNGYITRCLERVASGSR
jgi:hypothetical protein